MGQQEQGYRSSEHTMAVASLDEFVRRAELTVEPDSATVTVEQSGSKPSKKAAAPCAMCGSEQSAIRINVDGNTLLMESCDTCDIRRWQLEGERIDLQEALNQVGEHSGRRRSRS